MLVVGPNGAGKTNLLESLHVGTQGFSPRTRADAQLIRFGADAAKVVVRGTRGGVGVETEVLLRRAGGREAKMNGAKVERVERFRSELATLVFTPDRLAVVKGGPAVRRAYFDRALGRLLPAQAGVPAAYGEALGQRNAALRRVSLGLSDRAALSPWTERVAELGAELVAARERVLGLLGPGFAERAGELGLLGAALDYRGEPPTAAALEDRLDRDVERGSTGLGPHLDEIGIASGDRDLRSFGSQGEQRLAVLSLLLAEADLIAEHRHSPPLLASGRRPFRARSGAPRDSGGARCRPRADGDHVDVASGAAGRAGAGDRGHAGTGGRRLMERIGSDVERELGRFDGAGAMPRIVAVWPAVVGPEVARNAWPARVARDGTLHVNTSSSVWAFELGHLAPRILERLSTELGEQAPKALRFVQGHLPEPVTEGPQEGRQEPVEPDAGALAAAASLDRLDRRRRTSQGGRKSCGAQPLAGPPDRRRQPPDLIHFP